MVPRALLITALVACAHTTSVPITLGPNHELLVPAEINGEPVVLQLDTGASMTTLTPQARDRLGLRLDGDLAPGVGAAGLIAGISRTRLTYTEISSFSATNMPVAIIDLGTGVSDGLVGMDILQFFTIEVDLAVNQFTLHRRTTELAPLIDGLAGIPYTALPGGQITIAITIDRRPVTAILDLGANRSFANHLAAGARDETAHVFSATVGADGHAWKFFAFDHIGLQIGDVPFVAPSMLVADLPIFARLGLADVPAVILGADLLAARRIVVDPSSHRVYFSRKPARGASPPGVPARLRLV
jgi:hypothetical protein